MTFPTIVKTRNFKSTKVRFKPCCKDALNRIKLNLDLGTLCNSGSLIGHFVTLFSSNFIQFAINLSMTDWELFAKNIGKCSLIHKRRCIDICVEQQFPHSKSGSVNRDLVLFWKQMEKVIRS